MAMTEEEYANLYPYVVVHENAQDGAFTLASYATMREALQAPRMPKCKTPIVFGSWADYEIWKIKRMPPAIYTP